MVCEYLPMQCKWKICPQAPNAGGQFSPGFSQLGQGISKKFSQITQCKSLGMPFHRITPTVCTPEIAMVRGWKAGFIAALFAK